MTVSARAYNAVMNSSGASTNTITVGVPTDVAEGDLMIAITSQPTGTPTGTGPDNWELIGSYTSSTSHQSNLYRRFASASEPADYTWTFTQSSTCGVSIMSFTGARDILSFDARVQTATSQPLARSQDAARDAIGYWFCAWRDGADSTLTPSYGALNFNVSSSDTGSAVYRGITAVGYGPVGDIVNIGDSLPGVSFTPSSGALDHTITWSILVDSYAPDAETWPDTDGDFTVELNLDTVTTDSEGSVNSRFRGDVTGLVTGFSESGENAPDEITENLADGLRNTKWLTMADSGWVQYDFGPGGAQTVKRYRLTAANDEIDRDPYTWTLKGSNNGTDFTDLDTRTGESFGNRGEQQEFRVASPGEYRYYRLDIASNRGPSSVSALQLAEWRMSVHDVWEDVTERVRWDDKIRITRGFQGAAGRHDFSRAYFTLKNPDGLFTVNNTASPFYGSLQRNTQVRISKAYGDQRLQLQGAVRLEGTNMCGDGVRCVLREALQIAGDIDVRIDLRPESWRDEQMLCGVQTTTNDPNGNTHASWSLHMDDNGLLNWLHSPVGGGTVSYTSTRAVPNASRQAVRVTVDVDNGSSGSTATFYTADSISGEWTQLGEPVTESGTTSIGYQGGALCVGHVGSKDERGIHGDVFAFELRDGIDGTLVSDIDFTTVANGAHEFTENSNHWVTINNAVVSNRHYRFHGEVSEWPLYWDTTGSDVNVSVTAAGVQKRLERGSTELSAMYRHHTKGIISDPGAFERFAQPAAYWPCEDLKDTVRISSAVPNAPHMEVYGAPEFEGFSDFPGSNPLPLLKNAQLGGRIGPVGETGWTEIHWVMYVPETIAAGAEILSVYTTGSMTLWKVVYVSTNTWRIDRYDGAGVESGSATGNSGDITVDPTVGRALYCRMYLTESSSGLTYGLNVYDQFGALIGTDIAFTASNTFNRVSRVNVNTGSTKMDEVAIGHIAVYGSADTPPQTSPLGAHRQESAGARLRRLAAEEDIEYRYVGAEAQSALMGAQDTAAPFPLMSTCSVSDEGFLMDPLDAFGLEYRTGRSLYNQAPHLTLSYTGNYLSGELTPSPDDSHVVNDFTASRGEAGSARFRRDDGPLSVSNPPDGVGEYAGSQSYSFAHEGQCVQMASWQVHKGTLDEARYPRIQVALENPRVAADAELIEAILTMDVGRRVDITDLPEFLPPDDIRQIVVGYEEWFDNFQHDFTLNTLPERVYEIAEYDAGDNVDTYDTVLYGDHSAAATELTVLTSTGPGFTADPQAYPFDIRVDGEVMRALSVGHLVNTDPLFTAGVDHWGGQNCTISQDTSVLHPHPLCTATLKAVPNGGISVGGPLMDLDVAPAVTPQNTYSTSAWVYSPTGWSDIRLVIDWYDASDSYLGTSGATVYDMTPNVWTFIEETDDVAPDNAAKGRLRVRFGGTPSFSDVFYVWNAKITEVRPYEGTSTADSFNRADSTTSPGSTDQGAVQAWTEDLGAWGISSNQAYISSAGNSMMTVAGAYDFEELGVTVSAWPADEAWLVFRFTDVNNRIRWGGTVGDQPALQVINGGTITVDLSPGGFGSNVNQILVAGDRLSVSCHGSVIECFVNGKLTLSVSDETESGTRVGLQADTTAIRFNDFQFVESEATQTIQVERGVAGDAAPHKAASEVSLYRPSYRGL